MAGRRIGDKPFSEPMSTRFIDTYMRQYGEMSKWLFWTMHLRIYMAKHKMKSS